MGNGNDQVPDGKEPAATQSPPNHLGEGLWSRTGGRLMRRVWGSGTAGETQTASETAAASFPPGPEGQLLRAHADQSPDSVRFRETLAGMNTTSPETLAYLAKDKSVHVREAVAANAATPPQALSDLASDPEESVTKELLRNAQTPQKARDKIIAKITGGLGDMEKAQAAADDPTTPPEILTRLARTTDRTMLHSVAANPSTPAEILNGLSNNKDDYIRGGVARNISTPEQTLARLGNDPERMVRDSLAQNKSAPIETLANIALKDSDSYNRGHAAHTLYELAGDTTTSPDKLSQIAKVAAKAAGSRDIDRESLNSQLAGNPSTSPETLDFVADDVKGYREGAGVREKVAQNPSTSVKTLMKLADDSIFYVNKAALDHLSEVTNNPATSAESLKEIAGSDNERVRELAAKSTLASPELLASLATDKTERVKVAVAGNTATSPELLSSLAADSNASMRQAVAGNESAKPESRSLLAQDKEESVRAAVAANKATEAATLSALADDKVDSVRQTVASNPSTSAETLAKLSTDKQESVREAVLNNSSTPEATRAQIVAAEEDVARQKGQAGDWSTPPEKLAELGNSGDWRVRQAVAGNPKTSQETLTKLAGDERPEVKLQVAKNESTPGATLTQFTDQSVEKEVREAALQNKATPQETLTKIAENGLSQRTGQDFADLRFVAANPSTPPQFLSRFIREDRPVRQAAAGNESTPADTLGTLANDKYEDVRKAVASNQVADTATLRELANDSDSRVAAAVAANRSAPPELLARLSQSPYDAIKKAALENPSTTQETLTSFAHDQHQSTEMRAVAATSLAKRTGEPVEMQTATSSQGEIGATVSEVFQPDGTHQVSKVQLADGRVLDGNPQTIKKEMDGLIAHPDDERMMRFISDVTTLQNHGAKIDYSALSDGLKQYANAAGYDLNKDGPRFAGMNRPAYAESMVRSTLDDLDQRHELFASKSGLLTEYYDTPEPSTPRPPRQRAGDADDPLAGAEAAGTGEQRQTLDAQTKLALERVNNMSYEAIAAKARNPEEFRKELGIELPREREERERLFEKFKGSKLMSAGLAADWLASIFGL